MSETTALQVAVVGAGYMGKGIAQCFAAGGARVTLVDTDAQRAEDGHLGLLDDVAAAARAGLVAEGFPDRLAALSSWAPSVEEGVAPADLVIEVVPEDVETKHAVLVRIEAACRQDAVLATNTSSIPISVLAEVLQRPERFFGLHFFNPAPYLPSVEVIMSDRSEPSLIDAAVSVLEAGGKVPMAVADSPGFVCNRIQFAMFREAALMVEEGLATPESIDAVVSSSFGYRLPFFGPFAIADLAGLDGYAGSYKTLAEAYGDRFAIPDSLRRRVESGDLGAKTGGGYRGFSPEEARRLAARRDRSYVALAALRASLEEG